MYMAGPDGRKKEVDTSHGMKKLLKNYNDLQEQGYLSLFFKILLKEKQIFSKKSFPYFIEFK